MNETEQKNLAEYEKLYYNTFEDKSFEVLSKTKILKKIIKRNKISLRNKKVLEIGFGSGNFIPIIINWGGIYHGLEISNSAIDTCRGKYGNKVSVDFLKNNKINYRNEEFDIVIMSHVLEHIKNEEEILWEVVRILKYGGFLILGVPSLGCKDNSLHFRIYKREDLINISKKYFLNLINDTEFKTLIPFYFLTSIFRKKVKPNKKLKDDFKFSLLKKFYFYIISPILSELYSLRISKGEINEIWGVFKR